jgi:hypothetical protein
MTYSWLSFYPDFTVLTTVYMTEDVAKERNGNLLDLGWEQNLMQKKSYRKAQCFKQLGEFNERDPQPRYSALSYYP